MLKRNAVLGNLLRGIVATLLLGAVVPMSHAVVIYKWIGTCSLGCTGSATAVLRLQDSYAPGTELTNSDFSSFSYASSSGSFSIPGDESFVGWDFDGFRGPLPLLSGTATVFSDFADDDTSHETNVSGGWRTEFVPQGIIEDRGQTHSWSLVVASEPATLALFCFGLVGLVRRHKRDAI